jgi:hypothetical protein
MVSAVRVAPHALPSPPGNLARLGTDHIPHTPSEDPASGRTTPARLAAALQTGIAGLVDGVGGHVSES